MDLRRALSLRSFLHFALFNAAPSTSRVIRPSKFHGYRKRHNLQAQAGGTLRQASKYKFIETFADPSRDRVYDYKRRIEYPRSEKKIWNRL